MVLFVEQPLALPGSANKPAAQAAGADPFGCNSTSPPIGKIHPFRKIAVTWRFGGATLLLLRDGAYLKRTRLPKFMHYVIILK